MNRVGALGGGMFHAKTPSREGEGRRRRGRIFLGGIQDTGASSVITRIDTDGTMWGWAKSVLKKARNLVGFLALIFCIVFFPAAI
jgi:hypothetical protein